MRVLAWGHPERLNTPHRVLGPMNAMASRGHQAEVVLVDEEKLAGELRRDVPVDVVLVHRFHGRRAIAAIRELHAGGAAVVWDNDDDVTQGLPTNKKFRSKSSAFSQQAVVRLKSILEVATLVTTPSSVLAESYRQLGAKETRVVENYLAGDFAPVRAPRHDGVVIGMVAAGDHLYDVRELGIGRALQQVLDAHPDVRVVNLGVDLGLQSPRYEFRGFVPYGDLPAQIAGFDIALAPLADIRFNQCRANSKLKEYAAQGVPWLASPVGPYVGMGEKQGGRLVPDGEWAGAISQLVSNGRERRKLAKRAERWARGETLEKNAKAWEQALTTAVQLRQTA